MDIIRFGIVEYVHARRIQRYLVERRIAREIPDTILLCQHFPTLTLGKRQASTVVDESQLVTQLPEAIARQFNVVATDRGGLLTAHNPGQLILYPVIHLKERKLGVQKFVELVLGIVVSVLKSFDVQAYLSCDPVGVFVDKEGVQKKIAYAGLKIVRGVSDHGFSINVVNDLTIFTHIASCGLKAGAVTSLSQQCLDESSCWREFSQRFEKRLEISLI